MIFSDNCRYHSGYAQIGAWCNRWIFRIGRLQSHRFPVLEEILHCPVAVNFGQNYITVFGFSLCFYDNQVFFPYSRVNHGIAGDGKQK